VAPRLALCGELARDGYTRRIPGPHPRQFLDVWQMQGFKSYVFGSVASKGLMSPISGSVASTGLRG
jgi:hypothetical protein